MGLVCDRLVLLFQSVNKSHTNKLNKNCIILLTLSLVISYIFMPPFEEEGVYCFAHVGRSVGPSVRPPDGFRMITQERLGLGSWNFIGTLIMTGRWPLLILRSLGQRSRSQWLEIVKWFPDDNSRTLTPRIMKLHRYIDHDSQMTPIDFQVTRSKVKVTVTRNRKMVSGW